MSAFFNDQFSGSLAAITAHTSDSADTWAYSQYMRQSSFYPKVGALKINGSGVVGADTSDGFAAAYSSAAPPGADYYVEGRGCIDYVNNNELGLVLRHDETTGEGYGIDIAPSLGHAAGLLNIRPWKVVAIDADPDNDNFYDIDSVGGFWVDYAVANPNDFLVRLLVEGTSLRMYLNDALVMSAVTNAASTGGPVTGTGTVGFWAAWSSPGGSAYGAHWKSMSAGVPTPFWTHRIKALET